MWILLEPFDHDGYSQHLFGFADVEYTITTLHPITAIFEEVRPYSCVDV